MGINEIKFMSSHGIVLAHEHDCVSLTFGMGKTTLPHTPVMSGGYAKPSRPCAAMTLGW